MHKYFAVALQSRILHTGAQFHSIHPTCSLLHYRAYSDSVGIHCRLHTCLFPKQQDLSACDTVLLNPTQDRPILTRHKKSSPARLTGIGLNVVLLPAGGRVTGSCTTSSSSHSDRDIVMYQPHFPSIPCLLHTILPHRHKNTPLVSVRPRYLLVMTDRICVWEGSCGAVSSMQ